MIARLFSALVWSSIAAPIILPVSYIVICIISSQYHRRHFCATDRYIWMASLPLGVVSYIGMFLLSVFVQTDDQWSVWHLVGTIMILNSLLGLCWGLLLTLKNH